MKRLSPLLLAIFILTGCHAPMPSFNLLAPYGSTRIPPPSTGNTAPSTYYQPAQQPSSTTPVGTGFRASGKSTSVATESVADASEVRTASGSDEPGRIARATHETTAVEPTAVVTAATAVPSRATSQTAGSGASRGLPANIRGMHINEATVEPAPFNPPTQVIDITQLPSASSVRSASVVPINQAVGTSAPPASTSSQRSTGSSSAGGTSWQLRN